MLSRFPLPLIKGDFKGSAFEGGSGWEVIPSLKMEAGLSSENLLSPLVKGKRVKGIGLKYLNFMLYYFWASVAQG